MIGDTSTSGASSVTLHPGDAVANATEIEWARRGLRHLAERATGWMSASDTLQYLTPEFHDLPVVPRAKACLELGLLRLLWGRIRPADAGLAEVTAAVDAIWADPNFPGQLAAAPKYFRQYGLIYAALAPPGASLHRATLAKLAPGGHLATYGKSPYLRLETRYYADLACLDHGFESYQVLYENSELANATAAATDIEEAYRVTHTLFHITDFGFRTLELTEAERIRVLGLVEQMTDHFIAVEHWDLTAELLLSQHCLGQDPTRTRSGTAGVRSLLAVMTDDGRIPARYAAQRPPETSAPVRLFRSAYHTTLVTALASMLSLAPDSNRRP